MIAYFWVAFGGALGSVSRFWLNGLVSQRFDTLPIGTILINVTGSFLIGVIGALAAPEGRMDSQSRAFATQLFMYGICGGYTTFSSFSLQTLSLVREREWLYAGECTPPGSKLGLTTPGGAQRRSHRQPAHCHIKDALALAALPRFVLQ